MTAQTIWHCSDCGSLHQSLPHGLCPDRDKLITVGDTKLASYLQQENEVLIERVRQLEISLSSEREACAKVADAFGYYMEKEAFDKGSDAEMEAQISAAQHIATLIRGRGNADW